MKRVIDLLGSIAALIIFCPLMVAIVLFIYLSSPGPAIFKQKRLGRRGREFTMYKFRSMVMNAEEMLKKDRNLYEMYVNNSYCIEPEKDPRITKIGRFLRKTSLDELPQLFNVVRGDMSLVGPRPIVKEELSHYGSLADEFLSIRPGMTGYWQVSGRDEITYPDRVGVELYYIRNRSTLFDFKILLKTVRCILCYKSAYAPYIKDIQTRREYL